MTPLAPIRDKFERALRNGERLHLEPEQVRAFARTVLWGMLAELTAKELADSWESELDQALPPTTMPPACSSGHSGSGLEPNAANGASAGMMRGPDQAAVGRAASRRASEAVAQVGRRKRQKTH